MALIRPDETDPESELVWWLTLDREGVGTARRRYTAEQIISELREAGVLRHVAALAWRVVQLVMGRSVAIRRGPDEENKLYYVVEKFPKQLEAELIEQGFLSSPKK